MAGSETVAVKSMFDSPFLIERIRAIKEAAGPDAVTQVIEEAKENRIQSVRVTVFINLRKEKTT